MSPPILPTVLPIGVSRNVSHGVPALFWFCLPIGLGAYLLFHLVIKAPLLGLLPTAVVRRLDKVAGEAGRLPHVSWALVVLSLLLGSVTHLLWDAFTHENGLAVQSFPILRTRIFSAAGSSVVTYKLLQHASTVLGLLVVACWTERWLRRQPVGHEPRLVLDPSQRMVSICVLFGIPVLVGIVVLVSRLQFPVTAFVVRYTVRSGVRYCGFALAVMLIGFSLWWHLFLQRYPSPDQ